jgi:hypothetical protein
MYTFWDESTAILSKTTVPDGSKYVYEVSAPVELYLRTNISAAVDIGKVFPVDVGVKVIVFIVTFIVTPDPELY